MKMKKRPVNDRGLMLDYNIEGVQGVYWWLTHHYQGCGHLYQKLCAIMKVYKPGMMERGPTSDEAWRVYNALCHNNLCCGKRTWAAV